MRVIAKKALRDFWTRYPDAEEALRAWHHEADKAEWRSTANVKAKYGTASILKRGRVVFNVCGNKYRLVVQINFEFQIVYVRFVGTHKEYDEIDVETV